MQETEEGSTQPEKIYFTPDRRPTDPTDPQRGETGKEENPGADPQPKTLMFRAPEAIEPARQINIDARGPINIDNPQERRQPASRARFAKCGDCAERIPINPEDADETHHNAMRHKAVCKYNTVDELKKAKTEQTIKLLMEHKEQRALQLTAAPTNPAPAATREECPWWKFW